MLLLYHLCYLVMICLELVVGLIKAWLGTAPGFLAVLPLHRAVKNLKCSKSFTHRMQFSRSLS